MLNPALINDKLDAEEYANAVPTIGHQMLAHFSTPTKNNSVVYESDGLFFSMYPNQRMYLRPAFPGEFDAFTSNEDFARRPLLWILVTQLAPGVHERTPRWRGHAFWHVMKTDRDVAEVVMQMSERGGIHISEWYSWISDQRARKCKTSPKKQKKSKVNQ
jgi:hypothetical protein